MIASPRLPYWFGGGRFRSTLAFNSSRRSIRVADSMRDLRRRTQRTTRGAAPAKAITIPPKTAMRERAVSKARQTTRLAGVRLLTGGTDSGITDTARRRTPSGQMTLVRARVRTITSPGGWAVSPVLVPLDNKSFLSWTRRFDEAGQGR
jgi:hypothetical protein